MEGRLPAPGRMMATAAVAEFCCAEAVSATVTVMFSLWEMEAGAV